MLEECCTRTPLSEPTPADQPLADDAEGFGGYSPDLNPSEFLSHLAYHSFGINQLGISVGMG